MSGLPRGWTEAPLGEWLLPVESRDPARGASIQIAYFDISSIDNELGRAAWPKTLRSAEAPSRARQIVFPCDVLFSTVRPGLRAIAAVPEVGDAYASTGFCVMRPSQAIDSQYLFQLVRSDEFVQRVLPFQRGVSYPAVRDSDVLTLPIRVPPRREQTRIVAKLEELLSDLDAGVAELKAAQRKLTQYRQSLLKAAVEGALTAEWRTANPPQETGAQLLQRILTERRQRWEARQLERFQAQGKAPPKDWQKKYPEPVQPETSGLPVLPEDWTWASAEQLCEFITKGTTPPKEVDDGEMPDVPFLRVTNLTNRGVLDLQDQVFVSEATHRGLLARSVVYPNDVLINIVGPPLGQVALVPDSASEWNVNQAIAIFRAVNGVLPALLCAYLLSPVAQRWLKARAKTTAGQTNLTLELCRSLPVPLPPINEQRTMTQMLEEAVVSTEDQVSGAIAKVLAQSTAQRQNLLRAAFAGQLVPQDPSDEPASVLLDRIRAEREAQGAVKKPRGRAAKAAV